MGTLLSTLRISEGHGPPGFVAALFQIREYDRGLGCASREDHARIVGTISEGDGEICAVVQPRGVHPSEGSQQCVGVKMTP